MDKRKLTAAQKKRAAHHPVDADGSCRRCGVRPDGGHPCPPGFWMNAKESAAWAHGVRWEGV